MKHIITTVLVVFGVIIIFGAGQIKELHTAKGETTLVLQAMMKQQASRDAVVLAQTTALARQDKLVKAILEEQNLLRSELASNQKSTDQHTEKLGIGGPELDELAAMSPEAALALVLKRNKDIYRCLEIQTGSKLTLREMGANTKDAINSVCSDIANPNYVEVN
ncbi:MAG TPA: hypothetical protein EYP92_07670 [Candidatus Thioglobus sp.]|nr:hypothetical protein [Candidatus Thioglobus sp.]